MAAQCSVAPGLGWSHAQPVLGHLLGPSLYWTMFTATRFRELLGMDGSGLQVAGVLALYKNPEADVASSRKGHRKDSY